ncbi:MAG: flavodoxin, partial [Prevotella sp.]|nr:flavodoxin [Prevotella sp.]
MKKVIFMLAALMAICLSACSQSSNQKESKQMKTLVAYFSATGTTKGVAQQLAEVAGADIHEIKPEKPYTDADLDWQDKQSRSTIEMKDKSSRPAITDKLTNMQEYDVV